MKYLILALIITSCSSQFYINKSKRATVKAIDKGADLAILKPSNDTLYVNDTIILTEIVKQGDTIYKTVTKTVERVVYQTGEIRYISKKDKRKEARKVKIDSKREYKLEVLDKKTEKIAAKNKNKKRSYWLLWLLIGVSVGYLLKKIIEKVSI